MSDDMGARDMGHAGFRHGKQSTPDPLGFRWLASTHELRRKARPGAGDPYKSGLLNIVMSQR